MLTHNMKKYKSRGRWWAESQTNLRIFGKVLCLSKKTIALC